MTSLAASTAGVFLALAAAAAGQIDYAALWQEATPFHVYLARVNAQEEQWRSRFANAAIDADALHAAKTLPGRRRILAIAEADCSDSAWAVPFLAKLAAAVPEKLELRVIGRSQGRDVQAANLTPDGRRATPTIVILDEANRPLGVWVERPADMQAWFLEQKGTRSSHDLHEELDTLYEKDAGRSTVREVLALLERKAEAR